MNEEHYQEGMKMKQQIWEQKTKLVASIVENSLRLWGSMDDLEQVELDIRRRVRKNSEQFFRDRHNKEKADQRSKEQGGEGITWGDLENQEL